MEDGRADGNWLRDLARDVAADSRAMRRTIGAVGQYALVD